MSSAEVLQVYRGQECEALPGFSPMLEAYYVDLCRSDSRRPACQGRESRGWRAKSAIVCSTIARLSLRKTQGEAKPASLAGPVTNHANTIKYRQLWIHRDSMPQSRKHQRMTSRPCGLAKTACQICQGLATFGLLKMFVSVAWKGHPFCPERDGLSDLPLS